MDTKIVVAGVAGALVIIVLGVWAGLAWLARFPKAAQQACADGAGRTCTALVRGVPVLAWWVKAPTGCFAITRNACGGFDVRRAKPLKKDPSSLRLGRVIATLEEGSILGFYAQQLPLSVALPKETESAPAANASAAPSPA